MKITYTKQNHAPELATIALNGKPLTFEQKRGLDFYALYLATPSERVAMIRKALFSPVKVGKAFILKKEYEGENAWLNQTRSGRATYAQALALFKELKAGAIDGATCTIKARLIG